MIMCQYDVYFMSLLSYLTPVHSIVVLYTHESISIQIHHCVCPCTRDPQELVYEIPGHSFLFCIDFPSF